MNKKFYFSPKLNIDKINFDDILATSNIEIKDTNKNFTFFTFFPPFFYSIGFVPNKCCLILNKSAEFIVLS